MLERDESDGTRHLPQQMRFAPSATITVKGELMRYLHYVAALALLILAGCPRAHPDVQCGQDAHCNLDPGGVCATADTGNQWCAYPDTDCPSGYRYSDFDVGDGVGGVCVPETPAAAKRTLTVQLGGKGAGSITSEPAGLTCSADSCTGQFLVGATVKLSAAPTTGSFLGWIDGCRGRETCEVALESDRSVGALFGNPGDALWVKKLGSAENDGGRSIAIDNDGNLIAVGEFSQTITPASGLELVSSGETDIYVVKLAGATGEVIWAKRFGGVALETAAAVAVDASNAIYVTGHFVGPVDFGDGIQRQVPGQFPTFVLKLHANGALQWVNTISGALFPSSIVSKSQSLILAGTFINQITLNSETFTSKGSQDVFVSSLNSDTGAKLWGRGLGGTDLDRGKSAGIDSRGNVIVTGDFTGAVDFGGQMLRTGADRSDGFLLKLAPDGSHLLSRQFGGQMSFTHADGGGIVINSNDEIVIAGGGPPDSNFGCSNQPVVSTDQVFLAKYSPAGACLWVRSFPGSFNNRPRGIAVNTSDEIAMVGEFSGMISFGGQSLASAGMSDVFAARFSNEGLHIASSRGGSAGSDVPDGIAQAADGRSFATGSFVNLAEFGRETITAVGAGDSFIVSLAPL